MDGDNGEKCQKCGAVGDDRRTLWMACFYDMDELNMPLEETPIETSAGNNRYFYTMRVCKDCRADWMLAIKQWYRDKPEPDDGDIPVREFGTTRMRMDCLFPDSPEPGEMMEEE